jgi:transportin-1
MFQRSNEIIDSLVQRSAVGNSSSPLLASTLEVIGGLAQGLNQALEPLVTQSNPDLLTNVGHCLGYSCGDVRRAAYGLLGDLALTGSRTILGSKMLDFIDDYESQLLPDPTPEYVLASTNAIWSIGLIAFYYGKGE